MFNTYCAILEGFNGYCMSIVKNMKFFFVYNISFYLFKTQYKYLGKQYITFYFSPFLHIIYVIVNALYLLFWDFITIHCIHVAVSTQTTSHTYLGGMVFKRFTSTPDFKISILVCCF